MGTILDHLGSILVAGIVTIIVFSLNATMTRTAFTRTSEQISGDAATTMLEIVENDFYRIGYRVTTGQKIMAAESLRVSFAADLTNGGTRSTVIYAVGDTTQLTVTSNVHDRPLFRTVNSNPSVNIIQGLTKCSFAYYDTGGYKMKFPLSDSAKRAAIRGIAVTLTVEPGYPIDTTYIPVKMSKTIWPPNLGVW